MKMRPACGLPAVAQGGCGVLLTACGRHRTKAPGAAGENSIEEYYRNPDVQKRLVEFLGGESLETATARYITADGPHEALRCPQPVDALFPSIARGMEISRSLGDRQSFIVHLDLEYVNFDWPGEPYQNPERIFDLQAPVVTVAKRLLRDNGIHPLHLLSGRGHHLVWQIPIGSSPFWNLVEIGGGEPSAFQTVGHSQEFGEGQVGTATLTAGFTGLALVMELLAHEIKELAAPLCKIPVELTAVEAGAAWRDREMISIDISEYGDPLPARTARVPFSLFLKPHQQAYSIGQQVLHSLPPIFFIPEADMDVREGIRVMRDPRLTMNLARRTSVKIPEQTGGTEELIARYRSSSLRQFHDWYYSQRPHPPDRWPQTYDLLPLDALPGCARRILENPNDLLLRPSGMKLITRVMLALGWHPRHIAGLIRSKFERDHGWGGQWRVCNAAMRADFYTRMFSGLFAVGRDDLVDFNCQSAIEEKTCNVEGCQGNLEWFRKSALLRKKYDHLAHRPFNRLFLSHQYL